MALCRGHNSFPDTVRPCYKFQNQPVQNLIFFFPRFTQVLLYSDSSSRASLVARYTSFLLVSIIPLICDAILRIDDGGRKFWSAVFYALHSMLIYPILTALGVWGIYRQACEIFVVPFPNALSLQGL